MGLDMYLYLEHYVQNWDHHPPERRVEISITRGGEPHPEIDVTKISYVREQVAYWFKANAIHEWFVKNCQGGVDECQLTYVERETLVELRDLCQEVLDKRYAVGGAALARKKLPPQAGFFFGGTDIDEWYWESLQYTVDQLDAVLKRELDWPVFAYQSSW